MDISIVIPNFNSAFTVERAVRAMLGQTVPEFDSFRVVVVDDGSTDDSASRLSAAFGDAIQLIRLPANRGRATARNAGVAAFSCDLLVFVDSDCVPVGDSFVAAHVRAIRAGADVCFGQVCTPGDGFWDRIQRDASAWRLRRFQAGETWTFTTQNVAIRRTLFNAAGGFDPAFDRHGFEDRDLFVRLADAGGVVRYAESAAVIHEDVISLGSVARKLGEAGQFAAYLFNTKHPAVYREMAFSRIDCQVHPWLRVIDSLFWPAARALAAGRCRWLEWRWIPFRLRATAARAIYGLSFLHGTVLRATAIGASPLA